MNKNTRLFFFGGGLLALLVFSVLLNRESMIYAKQTAVIPDQTTAVADCVPTRQPTATPNPLSAQNSPNTAGPCSYLPIIQHQNHFTICPTVTPGVPPTPGGPTATPVTLQTANHINRITAPCVTITPWPTSATGSPTPNP